MMNDDTLDDFELEPDLAAENMDIESDDELEAALDERSGHSRLDGLKARGRAALSRAAERGRERLYEEADRRKDRLADAIDSAAGRLDERLSHGAEYLRTHDVDSMRDDLSKQIRRHPLLSTGIAVGTGYLIGRALSGSRFRPSHRNRTRAKVGRKISSALISGLGAMVASRVKGNLAEQSPRLVTED